MPEPARIEDLRRRVQLDPASIAFAALAEEYRRDGRFDEAIATCLAGLKRHPSYVSARVTLGRALMETGRYDEAVEAFTTVLRAAPENLAATRGLDELRGRLAPDASRPPASSPRVVPDSRLRGLESFLAAIQAARAASRAR